MIKKVLITGDNKSIGFEMARIFIRHQKQLLILNFITQVNCLQDERRENVVQI